MSRYILRLVTDVCAVWDGCCGLPERTSLLPTTASDHTSLCYFSGDLGSGISTSSQLTGLVLLLRQRHTPIFSLPPSSPHTQPCWSLGFKRGTRQGFLLFASVEVSYVRADVGASSTALTRAPMLVLTETTSADAIIADRPCPS